MERNYRLELTVGFFMLLGIICLGYLSIKLGKMEVIGGRGTLLYAKFVNVGGLKEGAEVEIAGVPIGRVKSIELDPNTYEAKVALLIKPGIRIQEDAIAAVKTKGLVGEKFIEITPGASDKYLKSGDYIKETQSAFSLEDAIGRLIFGSTSGGEKKDEDSLEE